MFRVKRGSAVAEMWSLSKKIPSRKWGGFGTLRNSSFAAIQKRPRSCFDSGDIPRCAALLADDCNRNNVQYEGYGRRSFCSTASSSAEPGDRNQQPVRSIYDTSSNWEDWFSPEEYADPWEFPDRPDQSITLTPTTQSASSSRKQKWRLEPLEQDGSLDSQSRYLIRQLQLIYEDGYCEEDVSSKRCLHMIGNLLSAAYKIDKDPQHKGVGDNGATLIRQRVLRAEAILRTMELFWDYIPDLLEEQQVNEDYKYEPRNQRMMTHWNHHKPIVKWPVPTYEIYSLVLRGLNSLRFPKQYQKLQNDDAPWICQDVVLRMHRFHKTKGMVYLESPSIAAFNQVLSTWANAHGDRDHPQKALHATQFFMDMKSIYKVIPDASSYGHVLRACSHHDQNDTAKELGAKLALKFWKGVLLDELRTIKSFRPTPFTFVFAIRALAGLKDVSGEGEADLYLREAWEEACRHGMVNEHVLYELEEASTPLFQELLSYYREKVDTHKLQNLLKEAYDKSYHHELMQFLPPEWTAHASGRQLSREEMINEPRDPSFEDSR